jgi:hypothetical protein
MLKTSVWLNRVVFVHAIKLYRKRRCTTPLVPDFGIRYKYVTSFTHRSFYSQCPLTWRLRWANVVNDFQNRRYTSSYLESNLSLSSRWYYTTYAIPSNRCAVQKSLLIRKRFHLFIYLVLITPIPVAALGRRSELSNPAGGLDVCFLWILYDIR